MVMKIQPIDPRPFVFNITRSMIMVCYIVRSFLISSLFINLYRSKLSWFGAGPRETGCMSCYF